MKNNVLVFAMAGFSLLHNAGCSGQSKTSTATEKTEVKSTANNSDSNLEYQVTNEDSAFFESFEPK